MTPQAQTSERERLAVALRTTNFVSISDQYAAADMLRADAEKIRALEADAARYGWVLSVPFGIFQYRTVNTEGVPLTWVAVPNLSEHIDAALAATQSPSSEAGEDVK